MIVGVDGSGANDTDDDDDDVVVIDAGGADDDAVVNVKNIDAGAGGYNMGVPEAPSMMLLMMLI